MFGVHNLPNYLHFKKDTYISYILFRHYIFII